MPAFLFLFSTVFRERLVTALFFCSVHYCIFQNLIVRLNYQTQKQMKKITLEVVLLFLILIAVLVLIAVSFRSPSLIEPQDNIRVMSVSLSDWEDVGPGQVRVWRKKMLNADGHGYHYVYISTGGVATTN